MNSSASATTDQLASLPALDIGYPEDLIEGITQADQEDMINEIVNQNQDAVGITM